MRLCFQFFDPISKVTMRGGTTTEKNDTSSYLFLNLILFPFPYLSICPYLFIHSLKDHPIPSQLKQEGEGGGRPAVPIHRAEMPDAPL